MNKQQIDAAREIAARAQFADEYHLAMMICSALGADYGAVVIWLRTIAA